MFRIKNSCGQSWCEGVGWVLPESGDIYDSLDDLPVELVVEGTPFEEAETFSMETLADDSIIYVSEQRPDDEYAVAVVEEVGR